jgi:hypothetical protein
VLQSSMSGWGELFQLAETGCFSLFALLWYNITLVLSIFNLGFL